MKLEKYGYLDFYMGSLWIESRANLLPFYRFIFQKKRKGCTWEYYFPKLSMINFKNTTVKNEEDSPEDYNPESSAAIHLEASKKEREIQEFGMSLTRCMRKPLRRQNINRWLKSYRPIKTSMAFCLMGTRERSWSNQKFMVSIHSRRFKRCIKASKRIGACSFNCMR